MKMKGTTQTPKEKQKQGDHKEQDEPENVDSGALDRTFENELYHKGLSPNKTQINNRAKSKLIINKTVAGDIMNPNRQDKQK